MKSSACHYNLILYVKMGNLRLTPPAIIGYNNGMLRSFLSLALRISLIAAIWLLVWRLIRPRTQLMRILRAAFLLACLLVVLALLRVTAN